MWEVVLVGAVEDWFPGLDADSSGSVTAAVDHMKELRPSGTSIRVLFLFDPSRQAILLVAGDKAGQWRKWYAENIPLAEERYEAWLEGGA